jgi:polyhydroxyalkanoate synthesis regulator phasin
VAERRRTAKSGGSTGIEAKTVAELREALRQRVMLTRERIEEVLADAVERGQITARDAQGLGSSLLQRGRKETNDVLKDLEQLLGRGRDEIEDATSRVSRRAARAAGLGSSFPISGYDELNVGQVRARLAGLTPAELRKVRDYERRNASRKTVLAAIEAKLS